MLLNVYFVTCRKAIYINVISMIYTVIKFTLFRLHEPYVTVAYPIELLGHSKQLLDCLFAKHLDEEYKTEWMF